MSTAPVAMSTETFYGYMHPRQNSRFYLALVVSVALFPLIALGLLMGTIVLLVPFVAFLLWVAMRIFFANMLGNSVLVSSENYPRILAVSEEIKARLGYAKPIHIFVYEEGRFNAYMRHLFFRRAIFLNSDLLHNGVNEREIRWIIGRFVGYMRARQQAGVLGWIIRAAQKLLVFNFFILPYERAMVYTGDRLALAEIDGDLTTATAAMQKTLVGRELGYSINPEGLIAQHRHVRGSIFGFLARAGRSFPHTTARYVDLVLFTRAFFPDQFKVFESANPGLPADLDYLGVSQVGESGSPRLAHAPWGWTCASATLVVFLGLVLVMVLIVQQVTAPSPLLAEIESTQPVPINLDAIPAPPPPPPNTHYAADGKLAPNPGCRWATDAPNDLRVVCGG